MLLVLALLFGEFCFAVNVKYLFGLKFSPIIVPLVTVVMGFAAFVLVVIFGVTRTFLG